MKKEDDNDRERSCSNSYAASTTSEEGESSFSGSGGMIPKQNRVYGSKQYWDERFSQEESYEWLLSYKQLSDQLAPFLTHNSSILMVGCGNSQFSSDMYDDGFHKITNIDYSEPVITRMKERHKVKRPEMSWLVMDMTDMSALENATFDVVVDKAAMDALMTNEGDVWNPNPAVVTAARSMCRHVARVLKRHGVFLQISLAQPHFRKKYLLGWHHHGDRKNEHDVDTTLSSLSPDQDDDDGYSPEFGWSLRVEPAGNKEASSKACFGHFLYVMKKDAR